MGGVGKSWEESWLQAPFWRGGGRGRGVSYSLLSGVYLHVLVGLPTIISSLAVRHRNKKAFCWLERTKSFFLAVFLEIRENKLGERPGALPSREKCSKSGSHTPYLDTMCLSSGLQCEFFLRTSLPIGFKRLEFTVCFGMWDTSTA